MRERKSDHLFSFRRGNRDSYSFQQDTSSGGDNSKRRRRRKKQEEQKEEEEEEIQLKRASWSAFPLMRFSSFSSSSPGLSEERRVSVRRKSQSNEDLQLQQQRKQLMQQRDQQLQEQLKHKHKYQLQQTNKKQKQHQKYPIVATPKIGCGFFSVLSHSSSSSSSSSSCYSSSSTFKSIDISGKSSITSDLEEKMTTASAHHLHQADDPRMTTSISGLTSSTSRYLHSTSRYDYALENEVEEEGVGKRIKSKENWKVTWRGLSCPDKHGLIRPTTTISRTASDYISASRGNHTFEDEMEGSSSAPILLEEQEEEEKALTFPHIIYAHKKTPDARRRSRKEIVRELENVRRTGSLPKDLWTRKEQGGTGEEEKENHLPKRKEEKSKRNLSFMQGYNFFGRAQKIREPAEVGKGMVGERETHGVVEGEKEEVEGRRKMEGVRDGVNNTEGRKRLANEWVGKWEVEEGQMEEKRLDIKKLEQEKVGGKELEMIKTKLQEICTKEDMVSRETDAPPDSELTPPPSLTTRQSLPQQHQHHLHSTQHHKTRPSQQLHSTPQHLLDNSEKQHSLAQHVYNNTQQKYDQSQHNTSKQLNASQHRADSTQQGCHKLKQDHSAPQHLVYSSQQKQYHQQDSPQHHSLSQRLPQQGYWLQRQYHKNQLHSTPQYYQGYSPHQFTLPQHYQGPPHHRHSTQYYLSLVQQEQQHHYSSSPQQYQNHHYINTQHPQHNHSLPQYHQSSPQHQSLPQHHHSPSQRQRSSSQHHQHSPSQTHHSPSQRQYSSSQLNHSSSQPHHSLSQLNHSPSQHHHRPSQPHYSPSQHHHSPSQLTDDFSLNSFIKKHFGNCVVNGSDTTGNDNGCVVNGREFGVHNTNIRVKNDVNAGVNNLLEVNNTNVYSQYHEVGSNNSDFTVNTSDFAGKDSENTSRFTNSNFAVTYNQSFGIIEEEDEDDYLTLAVDSTCFERDMEHQLEDLAGREEEEEEQEQEEEGIESVRGDKNVEKGEQEVTNSERGEIEKTTEADPKNTQKKTELKLKLVVPKHRAVQQVQQTMLLRHISEESGVEDDVEGPEEVEYRSTPTTPRSPAIDLEDVFRQQQKALDEGSDDMSRVRDLTTRLKLATRRPSYLDWTEQIRARGRQVGAALAVHAPTVLEQDHEEKEEEEEEPKEKIKREEEDEQEQRKKNLQTAVDWVKKELIGMRLQDQQLARQLMRLRVEVQRVRLVRSCHHHQALVEDQVYEAEDAKFAPDLCDLPANLRESFSPVLRDIGVTKMNLTSRRFSLR